MLMHTLLFARSPRWVAATSITVTAVSLALTLSGPLPARAHDALVQSSPAADSVVTSTPTEVSMTYSGELFDASSSVAVEVIDSSGANVAAAAPVVTDTTVTQPVEPVTASGVVTVRWRVVSSDGHPISGEYAFMVDVPVAPSPPSEPEPSVTATASDGPELSPATSPTTRPNTTDTVADAQDPQNGIGLPLLVTGAGVVVLGVAALVLLLTGRWRRQQVKQQTDTVDER